MRKYRSIFIILFVSVVYALGNGSQPQMSEMANTRKAVPKISFEKEVYDFGELAVRQKGKAEFRFKNIGQALLKIVEIKATCGCTVPSLSKKEYEPGEEGLIKIEYSGQNKPGTASKHISVLTNDPENSKIQLTIKAEIVQFIAVTPEKLEFSLDKEDVNFPAITLKTEDKQRFSIKNFSDPAEAITAEFDPNDIAATFTLNPKADIEKLRKTRRGIIKIGLTHPKCSYVAIPYEVTAKFQAYPSRIYLDKVSANRPQVREVLIKNRDNENFEIETVSSDNGYATLLSQELNGSDISLKLQITPPAKKNKAGRFSDNIIVKIKNNEELVIKCDGRYRHTVF